jgi:hypothetical protein
MKKQRIVLLFTALYLVTQVLKELVKQRQARETQEEVVDPLTGLTSDGVEVA